MTQEFSIILDFIRAVAASIVAFGHVRGGMFPAYPQLPLDNQTPINFFLFFITRLGMEAVIVFFVLSGYLVGGNALIEFRKQKFKFSSYIIKRLSRMYVVVIPALILGGICDIIRINFTSNQHLIENLSAINLLSNCFFLQAIVTPAFGSNLPLWTISCEFWYYILWALLILLAARFIEYITIKNKKNAFLFIGILLVCIAVTSFIPFGFLKYFPIWILGAAIRLIPISKMKDLSIKHIGLLVFSTLILVVATAYSNLKMALTGYYLVGVCFSLLLILISSLNLQVFKALFLKIKNPVKLLSEFSFSLYALHYPFQLLIFSIITEIDLLRPPLKNADLQGWIYLSLIMLIVYMYSYIVYFFTERNTGYLRDQMFFLYEKYKLIFNRN